MKEEIIKLIQQNKTKEALHLFKNIPLTNELKKTLSLVESEFNMLNQESLKGVIGFEEKQIRKNRINDKLLSIIQESSNPETIKIEKKRRLFLYILPILLILIGLALWNYTIKDEYNCPGFDKPVLNKILLIPFENVGSGKATPELVLRDRITKLTTKNNLSTMIKLGERKEELTIEEVPILAKRCNANAIIWGKYSNRSDSINLILQYYFLEKPNLSNMGELIVLKDITAMQKGEMLKNIEDSIMSLCSIIALRQGNRKIAKKWLSKIGKKEEIDIELSKAIRI